MKRLALLMAFALCLRPLVAESVTAPPTYTTLEAGVEERLGQSVSGEVVLNDEDGKPVKLSSLIDKPTILSLNYFRCSGICTPQLIGVLEVANKVQAEPGKDFQIITVSFDERDSPEMAWQKRSNFLKEMTRPFPPTAWRFLTGRAADSKAVCDSVGFRFKREGDNFAHAGVIMMLSPKGKITRYIYGVNYAPVELQMAITEAARGEARPSVNKWLKFCYTSDPAGKGYVFSATRFVAVLTLLGIGIFVVALLLSSRRKSRLIHGDHL